MKKFIPFLLILMISCNKEKPISIINESVDYTKSVSIYSDNYAQTIYDSCLNDSVTLSGLETYKLTQGSDSTGYYVRYEIDLSNVSGMSKRDSVMKPL